MIWILYSKTLEEDVLGKTVKEDGDSRRKNAGHLRRASRGKYAAAD